MTTTGQLARLLAVMWLIGVATPAARAHGAFPTSSAIAFGPGTGDILLGTNFGGVLVRRDGGLSIICESAVTGLTQSLGGWAWLDSGVVLGVVTDAGLSRGVFASDPSACVYGTVGGTEAYLMTDLAADPDDGDGYYATGADDARVVLLHGRAGQAANSLWEGPAGPAIDAATVRAGGGHAFAVISRPGEAMLVHHDGVQVTSTTHMLDDGVILRVLGVSSSAPTTLWLTRTGEQGDELLLSEDAGATLTPITVVGGRVGGFAMRDEVVWVQSLERGVYRSDDGGRSFAPLPDGPLGSCLAVGPDGRLFACGVPWRDGFALGVSEDGRTFSAVLTFFDAIEGPIQCAQAPETTALCAEELDFLRDYYGFVYVPPAAEGDASDGETGAPESVESVEPSAGAEVAEPVADSGAGDGCRAGAASWLAAWALIVALIAAGLTRRRGDMARWCAARGCRRP